MELNIGNKRPQQPNQMQINITRDQMKSAETVTCSCGCKAFLPATGFKKISGLLVGSPRPYELLPIQGIFVCAKCGEIAPFCKEDKGLCELLDIDD